MYLEGPHTHTHTHKAPPPPTRHLASVYVPAFCAAFFFTPYKAKQSGKKGKQNGEKLTCGHLLYVCMYYARTWVCWWKNKKKICSIN